MLRFKALTVTVVLLGVLGFGAAVAHAGWYWNGWYWNGWYWNGNTNGEGADFRMAWTVMPDGSDEGLDEDRYNYHADIKLRVPEAAHFQLIEKATTESIELVRGDNLECRVDGIEAEVHYKVTPLEGALGDQVNVWVTANAERLDEATGRLNETIKLEVLIPADSPSCYQASASKFAPWSSSGLVDAEHPPVRAIVPVSSPVLRGPMNPLYPWLRIRTTELDPWETQ